MREDEIITRIKQVVGDGFTVLEPINRETVCALPAEKWFEAVAVLTGELGIVPSFRDNRPAKGCFTGGD